jgi:hypothetical protein
MQETEIIKTKREEQRRTQRTKQKETNNNTQDV